MRISSTNRVAVIVLNWNGLSDTLSCVTSLEQSDYEAFDIIVVDNDSSEPDTISSLDDRRTKSRVNITLLRNDSNLGFSGGVNTGIRHAIESGYAYIALINNDAVVDRSWISELVKGFGTDDSIGIVTGSLIHKNKRTIDSTGEVYSIWGLPFPRLRNKPVENLPDDDLVFGATGGATLYKREVFTSIGLFDEAFFAYYEDVDVSFRAQLNGWKVRYTKKAIAYHTQGASSSKISGFTTKQAIRNLPLLFIKDVPSSLLVKVGSRFWFAYTLIVAKAVTGPHSRQAVVGWFEGVRLFWFHGITGRVKVQRTKKVDTAYMQSIMYPDLPPDQKGLRKLLRKKVQ